MSPAFGALHAYAGDTLRCPVCGRPHRDFALRAGDAWVTCWHRSCERVAWVIRIGASVPMAADICHAVGDRLGAAILASYAPACLVAIAVPVGIAARIRSSSHGQIVNALTSTLVGWSGDIVPAVSPPDRGKSSAESPACGGE